MKKTNVIYVALFTLMLALMANAGNCYAQNPKNSISFGGGGGVGPDASGTVFFLQYERLLSDRISLTGFIGSLEYEYDDDEYWEEGDGPGVQVDFRFYPGARDKGMQGFYLGGGFGIWDTEWDWKDDMDTAYPTSGSGDSVSIDVHYRMGGKINFGSSGVFIEPGVQLGYWVSSDAELDVYLFGILALGFSF